MLTAASRRLSRRVFLVDMGRGVSAIAVFGVAGCTLSGEPARQPSAVPRARAWQRLSLNDGFVSAYVLGRTGEAAVVDTGGLIGANVTGNEGDILVALEAAGSITAPTARLTRVL